MTVHSDLQNSFLSSSTNKTTNKKVYSAIVHIFWSLHGLLFVLHVTWQMWSLCIVMVKKKKFKTSILAEGKSFVHLLVPLCRKARKCTLLSCLLSALGSHDVILSEASSLQKKKINKSPFGAVKEGSLSHTRIRTAVPLHTSCGFTGSSVLVFFVALGNCY